MTDEQILIERDDKDIVTVTINRPEKLNALTKSMWGKLGETFAELSTDNGVRCIVPVSYTHLTLPTN